MTPTTSTTLASATPSISWIGVADALGGVFLLLAAVLCLTSAVGLLRLPDLYSRMHAASKPQALGMLVMLVGLGLTMRQELDVGMMALIAVFQLLTIPVSAHLLARAKYREVIGAQEQGTGWQAPGATATGTPDGEDRR